MKPLHLGTRLTLLSALVMITGILLCGAAATWFVHHKEVKELDDELTSDMEAFLGQLRGHGGPSFDWSSRKAEVSEWRPAVDPSRLVEVTDATGKRLFSSKPKGAGLPEGQPGVHPLELRGAKLRMVVRSENGITVRIAADAGPVNEITRELAGAFLWVLPAGLAISYFGVRWIARKVLEPLREITTAAEQITASRLDRRVPVPIAGDEIHRLATVLNETFDRLDQSFLQATRFTADASHELKTPLTILRTDVEALLHSPLLAPGDQEVVEELLEQIQRLSSITNNLLLLSRADSGKLTLDLNPGDLSAIAGLCIDDARILAEARSLSILADLPTSAPARIDRTRCAQIVMNLLDNAVKYSDPGGTIRLTLERSGEEWLLAVSNSGPGIPEEAVPNLFTRFFRAEHVSSVSGHGLGLSLSRELARAHHGDIRYEPDSSGQPRFVAVFPIDGTEPQRT